MKRTATNPTASSTIGRARRLGLAGLLAGAPLLPLLLAMQETEAPAPDGLDETAFRSLHLDQRWVTYRDSIDQRHDTVARWVAFLDRSDDFELLEQLAIYEGFQQLFTKGQPGEVLYRRDARQWMRVALWNIKQQDSHSMKAATSPLEQNPGRFLGWAARYKEVARLGGADLLKKLAGHAQEDPGDQLRPLDPQVVILPFLDAPREIVALRPGSPREPRTRYLHEVLRAIGAVSIVARFDEPYRGKLLRLTQHPHPLLRRAAMLEFSQFPADQVPHQELLALADDISLAVEDRRVAMLAATYSRRPEVYLRVHEVLRDPRHPGFLAVVNRMAAIGDEYSHHLLVGLDEALLDAGARVAVAAGRRTLMQKVQPDGKRKMPYVPDVARRLHLAVFARRTGHQDAAAFCTWTERYLRAQRANPAVRDRLTALATRPEKSTVPADDREAVRAWARRLLTAD